MNIYKSNKTKLTEKICNDPIYIMTQFYLPNNDERKKEILNCLKLMVHNNLIDKIYLLNERLYTDDELDIVSDKIKQINIEHRLLYNDCFNFIESASLNGFIIISNLDIFYDGNLINIKKSNLQNEKKVFCQLRYEYEDTKKLSECKLFTHNNQKKIGILGNVIVEVYSGVESSIGKKDIELIIDILKNIKNEH